MKPSTFARQLTAFLLTAVAGLCHAATDVDAQDVGLRSISQSYCNSIDGVDYSASQYFRDASDVLAKTGQAIQSRNGSGICCTSAKPWNGASCAGAQPSVCQAGYIKSAAGICVTNASHSIRCPLESANQWYVDQAVETPYSSLAGRMAPSVWGWGAEVKLLCEPSRTDGMVRAAFRVYEKGYKIGTPGAVAGPEISSTNWYQVDVPMSPTVKSGQINQGKASVTVEQDGQYAGDYPSWYMRHVPTMFSDRYDGTYDAQLFEPGFQIMAKADAAGMRWKSLPYIGNPAKHGGFDVWVTDAGCASSGACSIDLHFFLRDKAGWTGGPGGSVNNNWLFTAPDGCGIGGQGSAGMSAVCWLVQRRFVAMGNGTYSRLVDYYLSPGTKQNPRCRRGMPCAPSDLYQGDSAYSSIRIPVGARVSN